MRNQLLNNNLTDTISKGGVLYRPCEIPTFTKEQLAQAKLVSKLPHDFPIANWESMTTKQQLQQMKYSGLNPQEQWSLLNASAPLKVLNEYNQAQDQATAQALVTKAIAPLAAKVVQSSAQRTPVTNAITLKSTALQKSAQQRQLEEQNENILTKHLVKQPTNNPSQKNTADLIRSPQSYKPIERLNDTSDKGGDNGEPTSLWG